jgi:GntR family phosphonate transport system transcriptional regulator
LGRTALWTAIADALRTEIAAGSRAPGDRLPTEAELSERFGVNRHTVRRALAALVSEGLIVTRRGAGAHVAPAPAIDYPLSRRVRFRQNLAASGRVAGRRVLALETRRADLREAELLALPEGAPVHVLEGVSLADGVPLATFRSVLPGVRLPGLIAALEAESSITAALKLCGIADYTRAWTRLEARAASATQALHLQIAEGSPVMRVTSLNLDPEGRPLEYGRTWFAGDRVALTVTPGD